MVAVAATRVSRFNEAEAIKPRNPRRYQEGRRGPEAGSFNEAEAIKPRNPGSALRRAWMRELSGFNEAEAIKPRNPPTMAKQITSAVPGASMRPRQSSLGIMCRGLPHMGHMGAVASMRPRQSSLGIQPSSPMSSPMSPEASMRPRQSSLGIASRLLHTEIQEHGRCFNEAEAIKPRNPTEGP